MIDVAIGYGVKIGQIIAQIVVGEVILVNGGAALLALMSRATSSAASAELASRRFGNADTMAGWANLAVVSAVETFGAIHTFVFRNQIAADVARPSIICYSAVIAKLGTGVVVGIFGIQADATLGAVQVVVRNTSTAGSTVGTCAIRVFGKAHFVAERAGFAVNGAVPAVGVVGTTIIFKHLVAKVALNAVVSWLTAFAVFGA